jgi:hypothetical protein
LRKTFAVAQCRDTAVVGLFHVIDLLAGLPAGYMPKLALPKDTVQQTRATQDARVALV